jgi:hypothetical protein
VWCCCHLSACIPSQRQPYLTAGGTRSVRTQNVSDPSASPTGRSSVNPQRLSASPARFSHLLRRGGPPLLATTSSGFSGRVELSASHGAAAVRIPGGEKKGFLKGGGKDAPTRAHMLLPFYFISSAATTTSPAAASPPWLLHPLAAPRRPLPAPPGRGSICHAPPRATRGRAPSPCRRHRRRGGGLRRRPWTSRRRGEGDYDSLQLWLSGCDLLCSGLCFELTSNYRSVVLQSLLEFKLCALTSEV